MKKKLSSALLAVATKTPGAFSSYKLAYFKSDAGDYITNASFNAHMNPYTGKQVTAKGEVAKITVSEDDVAAVECHECNAYTVMLKANTNDNHIHCVICSAPIEITAEDDSDSDDWSADDEDQTDDTTAADDAEDSDDSDDSDDSTDDSEEDAADDSDDTKSNDDSADDSDTDDTADTEEDGDNVIVNPEDEADDATAGDDCKDGDIGGDEIVDDKDVTDVAMTDLASEEDDVETVQTDEDTVAVIQANMILATMSSDHRSFDISTTPGFVKGLNKAIRTDGVTAALTAAGFEPVTIKGPAIVAKLARQQKSVTASAARKEFDAHTARLQRCMDIVAAGSLRGMFANSGATKLYKEMVANLEALNVTNAKVMARNILGKSLPGFNRAMLKASLELTEKSDDALVAYEEQVDSMEADAVEIDDGSDNDADNNQNNSNDNTEDTDASVVARLNRPALPSRRTSAVAGFSGKSSLFDPIA